MSQFCRFKTYGLSFQKKDLWYMNCLYYVSIFPLFNCLYYAMAINMDGILNNGHNLVYWKSNRFSKFSAGTFGL